MAKTSMLLIVMIAVSTWTAQMSPATAQCESYTFTQNTQPFTNCLQLPVLNSFLHWTHDTSTNQLRMAYRHVSVSESTWVAWGINPNSPSMVGTQAIYAVASSASPVTVNTSSITSLTITELRQSGINYPVTDLSATFSNGELVMFGTWTLTPGLREINQVWQAGPVSGGALRSHAVTPGSVNLNSRGTLNLSSGQSQNTGSANSALRKRNIHGVLNAVSWGLLLPMGAVIARYLKVFKSADPAWFYLHVSCQTIAYIVGVAGWGTGLKIGSESPGISQNPHRGIGIALFCLGTLQVFALLLRPKKDHKYRFFWNIYHHMVGYAVIALSITNVYEGLSLLQPDKVWTRSYTGLIIAIAAVALVLEMYTWFYVIKMKKRSDENKSSSGYVANGNGRTHNNDVSV